MHGSGVLSIFGPLLAAGGSDVAHLPRVAGFLGVFYLALAVMNGAAALYWWRTKGDATARADLGDRRGVLCDPVAVGDERARRVDARHSRLFEGFY